MSKRAWLRWTVRGVLCSLALSPFGCVSGAPKDQPGDLEQGGSASSGTGATAGTLGVASAGAGGSGVSGDGSGVAGNGVAGGGSAGASGSGAGGDGTSGSAGAAGACGNQTLCGTTCVTLSSDNANCGQCNKACSGGTVCVSGTCQCSGQTLCGQACVDTGSDPNNCGACGTVCPTGQVCSIAAGQSTASCTTQCAGTQTLCGQSCVDVQSNHDHCGNCTTACAATQTCSGGACACPGGQSLCSGACVSTQTDSSNCGACGSKCSAPRTCSAGACNCPSGQAFCNNMCINTQTDASNCGACAKKCGTGQTCSAGACACSGGQTLCGTSCVTTQTDNANCGACGTVCGGGQTCTGGKCVTSMCTAWNNPPAANGNGELTCYWFGQGTRTGDECSSFKTYCGYCGTETGSKTSGNRCSFGVNDTVPNIGTGTNFAAFKGPGGTFASGVYCGMCVSISYGGKSVTATVVDACATCSADTHIDLSLSAAQALGLDQGSVPGDVNGATWKAVACPTTTSIVATYNAKYTGQAYFQNVKYPVAKAVAGGHTATQAFGYWDFGTAIAGQPVTLTDIAGNTATGTMPSSANGGPINGQFCP